MDADITEIARQLLHYAHDGNWRMAVASVLTGIVWVLRNWALRPALDNLPYIGPVSKFLKTDRGGVVLALSVGVLSGIGTTLAASQTIDLGLIGTGIVNGVLGAGIFAASKKMLHPGDVKSSSAATVVEPVKPADSPVVPPPSPPPVPKSEVKP